MSSLNFDAVKLLSSFLYPNTGGKTLNEHWASLDKYFQARCFHVLHEVNKKQNPNEINNYYGGKNYTRGTKHTMVVVDEIGEFDDKI